MKVILTLGALLCAIPLLTLMAQHAANANDDVGVRRMTVASKERRTGLDATVWYPALPGGKAVMLGETKVFTGTPALLDAPISAGRFPLVLLSHGAGLGGYPEALSWIATPLARQGFVVAAPRHPGNGGPDRSAAETMKLWQRPADVSDTLTAIEQDAFFQQHIDSSKVGILGLSMGGGTALAIAGARMDPERLARYCDTDAINPSLCEWVRLSGVDLHAMNMQSAGRDNEDKRIGFAMAIDPAPVDVLQSDTFARITIPVEIVNLGRPGLIPATVEADEIAKAISNARYSAIADASHFSMFAECKEGASKIAQAEKIEEPICADGGGRSRHEIHAQLIGLVTAAFDRELGSGD